MPVILFANVKGGTGKTTSAFITAEGLSRGASVAVLDCDRNRHLARWNEKRSSAAPFSIHEADLNNENTAFRQLMELESNFDFVVADMEGIKSQLMVLMLARADLVIIPLKPSAMEIAMAANTTEMIESAGEAIGREILYKVLLNRTNAAFQTRAERKLRADLMEAEIPLLENVIVARESYSEIFATGKTLEEMAKDRADSHIKA